MTDEECLRCGSVGGFGCYECIPERGEKMTDEAPKRKLLTKQGGLPTGNYPKEELVEYLRADHARALVAAAHKAAEKTAFNSVFDTLCQAGGVRVSVVEEACKGVVEAIRARTDEDAEKALADLLRKARNEGRRQAAESCQSLAIAGGDADDCEQAILILIEKEPGHE